MFRVLTVTIKRSSHANKCNYHGALFLETIDFKTHSPLLAEVYISKMCFSPSIWDIK